MITHSQETVRLDCPAGGALAGKLSICSKDEGAVVLFAHGLGSFHGGDKAQALECECARRGWSFAAFDFRGHGQSTGTLLELRGSRLLEDMETIRQFLGTRDISRLFIVGSSMGGWASSWFALTHPRSVAACVLIAPSFDFPSSIWTRLPARERERWKETGRWRLKNEWLDTELDYGLVGETDQFPVPTLTDGWQTPLLIFHGMKDETIPYSASVQFAERARFPRIELRLLKNGDHRLAEFKEETAAGALDFFEQQRGS